MYEVETHDPALTLLTGAVATLLISFVALAAV